MVRRKQRIAKNKERERENNGSCLVERENENNGHEID